MVPPQDVAVPALIRFFVELCLLRRAPQDLPASPFLFWLTLAADLAAGLVVGLVSGLGPGSSLLQGTAELALMLGLLYWALRMTRHPGRFIQAATALLGTGALVGVLAVVPLSLDPTGSEASNAAALGAFLLLALVAWHIVISGHILRHSFGITMGQGIAIAVAFQVLAIALIGVLFGQV